MVHRVCGATAGVRRRVLVLAVGAGFFVCGGCAQNRQPQLKMSDLADEPVSSVSESAGHAHVDGGATQNADGQVRRTGSTNSDLDDDPVRFSGGSTSDVKIENQQVNPGVQNFGPGGVNAAMPSFIPTVGTNSPTP